MAIRGSQCQHIPPSAQQEWDSRATAPAKLPTTDTSGMSSSTQVRSWQPCSSPAFYTPPAQAVITATHGPKAPLPLKQLTPSTWSSPCHAGTPQPPPLDLPGGLEPSRAEPEPWECMKQPGGHQNLLGTGRTRALPGDRVGQGANTPSPTGTGVGTTLWDRARQPWLPVPHRAQIPTVLGTAEL